MYRILLFFVFCFGKTFAQSLPSDQPIYDYVELMPNFDGGIENYLSDHLLYPKPAVDSLLEGKVILKFIVNANGTLKNIKIVKSVHPLLDSEAVRVVENMPTWIPGRKEGNKVNTYFTMPVSFKLNETLRDSICLSPDIAPKFRGKSDGLCLFVHSNTEYPPKALQNNIQGDVAVKLIIDKEGKISQSYVTRTNDTIFNSAILTMLQKNPIWNPAIKNGKPIASKLNLNFTFSINKNGKGDLLPEIFVNEYPKSNIGIIEYLNKEVPYEYLLKKGLEKLHGIVEFSYAIDEDGRLKDVHVTKSVSPALDTEITKALLRMPKFVPATQNCKDIIFFNSVRFIL